MQIQYRYQSYEVDPCTFTIRGDSVYARLSISGRVPMVAYVKVTPPAETLVYTVPLPPIEQQLADDIAQARIEWNWPHVFVTRELANSISASANVRICIGQTFKLMVMQPTLYTESMVAA